MTKGESVRGKWGSVSEIRYHVSERRHRDRSLNELLNSPCYTYSREHYWDK